MSAYVPESLLDELGTAVGQRLRAVRDLIGGRYQQVFVQQTQPATISGQPWVWHQTDADGDVVDYFTFDGVL
jgi:hypothetical protein